MQQQLERLLTRLEGVKGGKGRWQAKCPSHEDRLPSLSITEADDKILIHCFAGCAPVDVLAAVDLELSDLFAGEKKNGFSHHGPDYKRRCIRAKYAATLIAAYAGTIEKHWDDLSELLGLDAHDQALLWGAYRDIQEILDGRD